MAELQAKEMELTADESTAELVGISIPSEPAVRPQLVKVRRPEVLATSVPVAERMPLFSEAEMGTFRTRWSGIQTGFVDEPRKTVEAADTLVAAVMERLAEGFAAERSGLERQWDGGGDVSTENLRVALQRYRSFFDRLLKL